MNKRYALIPSERNKPCTHEHAPYSGRMPCTGPRVCSMCGTVVDDIPMNSEYEFINDQPFKFADE